MIATALTILSACGGGSGNQSPDPVILDLPIAYVKRPVPMDAGNVVQPETRELLTFNAGGDLWIRDRANAGSPSRNVTLVQTEGTGDVKDVEASFDGELLVFAMREPERVTDLQPPTWNLWVYDIANRLLKRIISDNITAEQGEDVAPHFLADGTLIFSSTRQSMSKIIRTDESSVNNNNKSAYTALDEDRNEQALVLHKMEVDCSSYDTCNITDSSSINQISFNQSHDLDASLLSNGKLIFTRWDNAANRSAMHLYQSNPDGTDMTLVYGRQSHDTGTVGTTVQFTQPKEMPDGNLLSILKPFTGTYGGGDIIAIEIANYTDNSRPILPNTLSPIFTGQFSLTNNNVETTTAPSPGGRYSSAYPLWDGSNRILVSWTPCRLQEGLVIVPCTTAKLAATPVEAPPLYGLFIFDPVNQTQLPIFQPEEGVIYNDIVVAQRRTAPTYIPNKVPGVSPELDLDLSNRETGILHIRSVYDLDGKFSPLTLSTANRVTLSSLVSTDPDGYNGLFSFSDDNRSVAYLADTSRFTSADRPARFLRIVKAVGIPFELAGVEFDISNDAFGISTQQGMREIIGYAPIEPDGSVMVEVPANVPLAISVVDSEGRRISQRHLSWIQVKAGETVVCAGCHSASPSTVDPVDGIHGHRTDVVGVNAGAPQNGYIYPGTTTSPLIVGDTINGQTTGQTMAQARYGDNCNKTSSTDCRPTFDIEFNDIWTNGTEAAFSYEFRQLLIDEVIPLTVTCYDPALSTNKWQAKCRNIVNYETVIQPIWEAARTESVVCDPTLVINDPRCDPFLNPPTPPVTPYVFPLTISVSSQCTSCHTLVTPQTRLALNQDPRRNANHYLSYTELMTGTTLLNQPVRDPTSCIIQTTGIIPTPVLQTVNVPAQMSVNGALASVFFNRFETAVNCQTVDHTAMLSTHEKKLLYEWLDIGAQYFNDPTNAGVPLN